MKEKYIVTQEKNGRTYITVKFSYKVGASSKTYSKTFSVSDYPSKAKAMQAACRHRDIKRAELLTVGLPETTIMHPRELFEMAIANEHLSANTKTTLTYHFDNYLSEYNEKSIQQITAFDIEESLSKLRFTKSQSVINKVMSIWKKITRTARRLHLITTDPTEEVIVPKSKCIAEERSAKMTDDETIDKVIDYLAHNGHSEASKYNNQIIIGIILTLRYTGIRPSECFALTRSDIDFDERVIRINSAYGTNEEGKAVIGTKTRLSNRVVPISMSCAMVLRSIMSMSENEYIFMNYRGKMPDIHLIGDKLNYISKKLGISFNLYALRHQFSSDLITSGVDPRTVMELMGHSSTDMTVGTYARSNIEKKRDALVEIGRKSSQTVSVYGNKLN